MRICLDPRDLNKAIQREHNRRLAQVLERSRKVGLKLNRNKMKIMTTEVPYIGHILTANGLKPDPNKICAVEQMPSPTDKPALGMVNNNNTQLS